MYSIVISFDTAPIEEVVELITIVSSRTVWVLSTVVHYHTLLLLQTDVDEGHRKAIKKKALERQIEEIKKKSRKKDVL